MSGYDMDILAFQGREYAFKAGTVRVAGKLWEYRRHNDAVLADLDIPPSGAMQTSRPTGVWGHFVFEGGVFFLRAVMTFAPDHEPVPSDQWVLRRAADGFAWDWSRGGFWPKASGYEYTLTEPAEATGKDLPLYEASWYFRSEPLMRLTVARKRDAGGEQWAP